MTEVTVKVNTRELTRQLNDLDLLQYQFKTNELKEFIKENLEVVEIGSSEDIRFYLSLKKKGEYIMTENERINLAKNHTNGLKTAKTIIEAIQ